MLCYDGHIVVTSELRFAATSPGATWTIPNEAWMSSENTPGLCIVHQSAESTTATPPALVTPAGWTAITAGQNTLINTAGRGMRFNTVYKLITSADFGDVITGMNGTQTNRVCAEVLFFNRPLQSVTVVTGLPTMAAAATTVGSRTGTDDSVRALGHIWWAFSHGENSIADGDVTMDTDGSPYGSTYGSGLVYSDFGYGGASVTRTLFQCYPYNDFSNAKGTSPNTNSVMSDAGNWGFDSSMVTAKSADSGGWNTLCVIGMHLY